MKNKNKSNYHLFSHISCLSESCNTYNIKYMKWKMGNRVKLLIINLFSYDLSYFIDWERPMCFPITKKVDTSCQKRKKEKLIQICIYLKR